MSYGTGLFSTNERHEFVRFGFLIMQFSSFMKREREREKRESVCVCVRERERESEIEWERERVSWLGGWLVAFNAYQPLLGYLTPN